MSQVIYHISHSSGLSISRWGTQFTRLRNSIPDEKQFFQETLYQCSYRRANAYIGGPDLLTWKGIYHLAPEVRIISYVPGTTLESYAVVSTLAKAERKCMTIAPI
jgi:hypothetical protein